MNRWTLGLALLTIGYLLAGCLSTAPEAWTHQPDEQTRARRAIYECKADVDDKLRFAAAFGGVIVPIIALAKASGNFDTCMASRGYVKP